MATARGNSYPSAKRRLWLFWINLSVVWGSLLASSLQAASGVYCSQKTGQTCRQTRGSSFAQATSRSDFRLCYRQLHEKNPYRLSSRLYVGLGKSIWDSEPAPLVSLPTGSAARSSDPPSTRTRGKHLRLYVGKTILTLHNLGD